MSFVYNNGALHLLGAATAIDWAADTIKARLVLASVTPNKDDTSMTGHTGAGTDVTLGSKSRTNDTTNDRIVYDAADPTWTAVAAGPAVASIDIFKFVTNDAGSTPIANITISSTTPNGGDLVFAFSASGIFYLQQ